MTFQANAHPKDDHLFAMLKGHFFILQDEGFLWKTCNVLFCPDYRNIHSYNNNNNKKKKKKKKER